jgi:hypothetical protein
MNEQRERWGAEKVSVVAGERVVGAGVLLREATNVSSSIFGGIGWWRSTRLQSRRPSSCPSPVLETNAAQRLGVALLGH